MIAVLSVSAIESGSMPGVGSGDGKPQESLSTEKAHRMFRVRGRPGVPRQARFVC